ncbi:hypothetical protein N5K27_28690, partial [Pigmentiphaga sp. GD03639]|uniref:endonuclease toxin domain-containing protein n=1 Tax=Pigmentiphaga sp. GD03639 TaxID=2975354 RepID=UPI00244762A9
ESALPRAMVATNGPLSDALEFMENQREVVRVAEMPPIKVIAFPGMTDPVGGAVLGAAQSVVEALGAVRESGSGPRMSTVVPEAIRNAPVLSQWDGRSGGKVGATQTHPFYGSVQHQLAISLQDGVGTIAGPEIAIAKVGALFGSVVRGVKGFAAESGVWKLSPLQRGQQIEQALGHNLPGNFPTIDRFENGLATSIKSLDLDAAAYQSATTLNRTLTGYVDKVADFQGRTWAGIRIRQQDITGRALDLAIPHRGSAEQQAIISQTVRYGASRGVAVNVIPFP